MKIHFETQARHDFRKISSITLILLLTVSATIAIIPSALAYTAVPDRATKTVVGISPTNVGKGQQVIINIMTYPAPAGPTYYAQDVAAGLLGGFSNISVSITKPDGHTDTYMPIDETLKGAGIEIPGQAQIVGSLMFYYHPDQTGNYSVTASFPGKTYTTDNSYPSLNLSVYYKPSSTQQATTFSVQEEPVLSGILNGYPWSPLPLDYWENPVQTDNREWAAISGDWVMGNILVQQYISSYNEYSTAPKTSHIVWANQVSLGGIVGGEWGSLPYNGGGGDANIILEGKIYQASSKAGHFECIDQLTGETLWTAPGNPTLAHRLDPFFQTASQANEGGISASLWEATGTSWKQYDPFDGDLLQTITNAPSNLDTVAFSDGNPYVFVTQTPGGNFGNWGNPGFNNTRPLGIDYSFLIKWDMSKVTGNNWQTGIVWNVSTIDPTLNIYEGEVNVGDNGFFGVRAWPFVEANVVVVRTHNAMQIMEGYDYTTGEFLWRNNHTVLDIGVNDADGGPNGPIILIDGSTAEFVAYNVKTGQEQWRASMGEMPWGMVPNYCYAVHNGTFFTGSYDGHVYAYDLDNGSLIWQSDYYGDEDESLYGTQPFNGRAVGADGVLFYSTDTVYQLMPRTRFHALVAINETTGNFIWRLPIGAKPRSIANGYLIATDGENGIQYCIGKGKTATSITAPTTAVTAGTSVLIQGTVMDMSPGKPNTPAVSDDYMDQWMDYLYGQNATLLNSPPSPDGVPVRILAIDSNGNPELIGTTISDSSGHYSFKWTPDTPDVYKIAATFDGSESYWGSWAQTGLAIEAASETSPSTSATSTPPYEMYTIGTGIAIIIAIAIVGLLILRKRP
jgi:outer membrane protein assembly factor BamB